MVQSLQLGRNPEQETAAQIRRVNRLPLFIGIGVVFALVAIIYLGLMSRGILFPHDEGPGHTAGNPASDFAEQIKGGVSNAIIGEPRQQVFQPTPDQTPPRPDDNPFAPEAATKSANPAEQNLEPESVWRARLKRENQEQYFRERQRQRMARLQANGAAYDAPIAINNRKFGKNGVDAKGQGQMREIVSEQTGMAGNPRADIYAAALEAGLAGSSADPNGQRNKEEFFNRDLKEQGYLAKRVVSQLSPYELKRGSVIPATLISALNSDLPGRISAQVSQNVFDSATGHHLLVPQGTKLFGRYDSKVSFGQSRVLVVWTDLVFPDGSTIQIDGMPGTDEEGYGGFKDKVNNHYLKTFGSAGLIALIGTGIDLAIPQDHNANGSQISSQDAARRSFAETFGRLADKTVRNNMEVQPTLEVRPGYKFNVIVDRDIVFPGEFRN
ncbi:IncP-type conjugal transfer protein TrbI [Brucella cytisi]|uniref:IncP-type conjugal transfer protein TrbI n=1 Tax=Brucella cytisi TaxID=407152 RepID=UPI0035D5D1C5